MRRSAVSRATPSTTRVARCHPHALALILALALIRTLALTLKAMVVALILALALIRTLAVTLKAMVVFTKEAADGGAVEYMK